MGKKRIIKAKKEGGFDSELKTRALGKVPKKKMNSGVVYVQSTYNNTRVTLADKNGDVVAWSSAGNVGFKGAKKGTPFAASKVAELIVEKGRMIGLNEIDVEIKGVGAGRESALRSLISSGLEINSIKDTTPIPHNGPKPRKPRRV